jgi:hypothetical protein
MRTSEQPTADLDDETRAFTKAMADCCRRDPAGFATLVRAGDKLRSLGVPEAEVRRLTLDALRTGQD